MGWSSVGMIAVGSALVAMVLADSGCPTLDSNSGHGTK